MFFMISYGTGLGRGKGKRLALSEMKSLLLAVGRHPNTRLSLEGCCFKQCSAAGRGASRVEEGWHPHWCMEVTMGYCSHLGRLEAFISVFRAISDPLGQPLNGALATNGTGLLLLGEARRAP